MRVEYFPRTEYDRGIGAIFPHLSAIGGVWTVITGIPFAGILFIHTGLEVR